MNDLRKLNKDQLHVYGCNALAVKKKKKKGWVRGQGGKVGQGIVGGRGGTEYRCSDNTIIMECVGGRGGAEHRCFDNTIIMNCVGGRCSTQNRCSDKTIIMECVGGRGGTERVQTLW